MKKYLSMLVLFLFLSLQVYADLLTTLGGVNTLLYGVAAGIAALMITMHLVRWKTAENSNEREEAKKGIIHVILALILIMIAGTLVGILFVKPPDVEAPLIIASSTTRLTTTTTGAASTTTEATSTTTTTTYIPPEKLLTAKNLVDCVRAKNGKLQTVVPVSGCAHCRHIKCMVFGKETQAPVGPGLVQYFRLPRIETSVGPYWIKADGTREPGCKTMPQINDYYGCDLVPVPGHTYYQCREYDRMIQFDC
jgi:hypothetical protein